MASNPIAPAFLRLDATSPIIKIGAVRGAASAEETAIFHCLIHSILPMDMLLKKEGEAICFPSYFIYV